MNFSIYSILLFATISIISIAGCGSDTVVNNNNNTSNVIYQADSLKNLKDVVPDTIIFYSGAVDRNATYKISFYIFRNDTNQTGILSWGSTIGGFNNGYEVYCNGGIGVSSISVNATMSSQFYNWDNCIFYTIIKWNDGITDPTKYIKLANIKIEKTN